MRVLAVLLLTSLALTVRADGHGVIPPTGDPILDYWNEVWVDPKLVQYKVCWESHRVNTMEDGSKTETALHRSCWQELDYPSWLVAERMVLEVPATILESWGGAVSEMSAAMRAMLSRTEFWGGP